MTTTTKNALTEILLIGQATTAARKRTGDNTIGTSVKNGQIQIVRVTFAADGKSTVQAVSSWMPCSDVIVALSNF